jgi:hypothetical protein
MKHNGFALWVVLMVCSENRGRCHELRLRHGAAETDLPQWNWLPCAAIFDRILVPVWQKPTVTRSWWKASEIVAGHMVEYSGMSVCHVLFG